jgi:ATP-dependent Clp protease ATP-binding subunit ClpX
LEGTVARVPPQGGRKNPQGEVIPINTNNILFICGGAFEGLDKIILPRVSDRRAVGFHGEKERAAQEMSASELLQLVTADDLLHFGMIPEFVGRIPVVVGVDPLDRGMLIQILTEPKNSIVKQYQRLFALDNVQLTFTPDALDAAAEDALKYHTGARGLRTIIESILLDVMYEIPSRRDIRRCVITAETIRDKTKPRLLTQAEQPVDWQSLQKMA